jgi:hypothetical protein
MGTATEISRILSEELISFLSPLPIRLPDDLHRCHSLTALPSPGFDMITEKPKCDTVKEDVRWTGDLFTQEFRNISRSKAGSVESHPGPSNVISQIPDTFRAHRILFAFDCYFGG